MKVKIEMVAGRKRVVFGYGVQKFILHDLYDEDEIESGVEFFKEMLEKCFESYRTELIDEVRCLHETD